MVIIGGTGRVGSSAAAALLSSFPNVKVTLAGRSKASYEAALLRRPELRSAEYKQVDISDAASVQVRRGAGNRVSVGGLAEVGPLYWFVVRPQQLLHTL